MLSWIFFPLLFFSGPPYGYLSMPSWRPEGGSALDLGTNLMVARILPRSFPGPDFMAQGRCQPPQHFGTFWGHLSESPSRSGHGLCTSGDIFAPSQCWKDNHSFRQPHMRHSQHLYFRRCGKVTSGGSGLACSFSQTVIVFPFII